LKEGRTEGRKKGEGWMGVTNEERNKTRASRKEGKMSRKEGGGAAGGAGIG
jgi:hypothetical protein